MNKKVMSAVGGLIVCLAFLAGAVQGCGSSGSDSSGTDVAALCNNVCTKTVACLQIGTVADCKTSCTTNAMSSGGQHCTNEAAIVSAFNACLAKTDCDQYLGCIEGIPPCQGGGAAGTSGT